MSEFSSVLIFKLLTRIGAKDFGTSGWTYFCKNYLLSNLYPKQINKWFKCKY